MEYSILIIIILAVYLSMENYVKRGVQGRWKTSVDSLGDQYDPRTANTYVNYALSSSSNSLVMTVPDGAGSWTKREDTSSSIETKAGNTTIGSVSVK